MNTSRKRKLSSSASEEKDLKINANTRMTVGEGTHAIMVPICLHAARSVCRLLCRKTDNMVTSVSTEKGSKRREESFDTMGNKTVRRVYTAIVKIVWPGTIEVDSEMQGEIRNNIEKYKPVSDLFLDGHSVGFKPITPDEKELKRKFKYKDENLGFFTEVTLRLTASKTKKMESKNEEEEDDEEDDDVEQWKPSDYKKQRNASFISTISDALWETFLAH